MKCPIKRGHSCETGAMLVFLVIALIPLLLLLSLAIDSASFDVSHSQEKRVSNAVALAALEAVQEGKKDVATFDELRTLAVDRATTIAGLEANHIFSRNINLDTAQLDTVLELKFGRWWSEGPRALDGNTSVDLCPDWASMNSDPSKGNYNPSCPCPDGQWRGACFEEIVPDREAADGIIDITNAVRVNLHTRDDAPLRSIFASLVSLVAPGEPSVYLSQSSTSAIVPRDGIFLIDLSRSVTFDTHLPFESGNGARSSEYVFPLRNSSEGNLPGRTLVDSCSYGSQPCYDAGGALVPCAMAGNVGSQWDRLWNGAGVNPPIIENFGPRTADVQKHYKSDYICVTPDSSYEATRDSNGAAINRSYLVNVPRDDSDQYRGAEPLNTIFAGIHSALVEVKNRSVAGDRIGLIAFDQGTDLGARVFPPVRPSDAAFDELLDLTDVDADTPAKQKKRLEHFLFAREGAETDLAGALWRARNELLNLPSFSSATHFVALFSDGMVTCAHQTGANHWMGGPTENRQLGADWCIPPTQLNLFYEYPSASVPPGRWNTAWSVHDWGLMEVTQLLSGTPDWGGGAYERHQIVPRFPGDTMTPSGGGDDSRIATYQQLGIQFHFFYLGNGIMPHTILQAASVEPGGPKKCLDDADRRAMDDAGNPGVQSFDSQLFAQAFGAPITYQKPECAVFSWRGDDPVGWWTNRCDFDIRAPESAVRYLYGAPGERLYNWGTLPTGGMYVPVRPPCSASTAGFNQSQCEAGDVENWINSRCAAEDWTALKNAGYTSGGFSPPPDWTTRAILSCDPKCRTQRDQVVEAVRAIFSDNPYILVE